MLAKLYAGKMADCQTGTFSEWKVDETKFDKIAS
jgi:hypothetical protein